MSIEQGSCPIITVVTNQEGNTTVFPSRLRMIQRHIERKESERVSVCAYICMCDCVKVFTEQTWVDNYTRAASVSSCL